MCSHMCACIHVCRLLSRFKAIPEEGTKQLGPRLIGHGTVAIIDHLIHQICDFCLDLLRWGHERLKKKQPDLSAISTSIHHRIWHWWHNINQAYTSLGAKNMTFLQKMATNITYKNPHKHNWMENGKKIFKLFHCHFHKLAPGCLLPDPGGPTRMSSTKFGLLAIELPGGGGTPKTSAEA